jgi:hypothetical protein
LAEAKTILDKKIKENADSRAAVEDKIGENDIE